MSILNCNECPRNCGVARTEYNGTGFCKMGSEPVVAKATAHLWEEPYISGTKGSGAVFFSGCTLRCIYCQNYKISANGFGKHISTQNLADIYKNLYEQGVHNINLISGSHFVTSIIKSLDLYKPPIPIIYNCSGYESVESVKRLNGYVDVFLPDFKYANDELAVKYSKAPNYTQTAIDSIRQMIIQTGSPVFDSDSLITSGTVIRHLVLPSNTRNSIAVLNIIKENFGEKVLVSLMSQYLPFGDLTDYNEINRKITKREYEKVVTVLINLGLDGFLQELSSAKKQFVPDFDLTGIV